MAEKTKEAAAKSDVKSSKVPADGKVRVVLANGQHVDATVTDVNKGDRVDLVFEHPEGNEVVITNSPFDATGKLPDSWHVAAAAKEKEAPKA